LEAVMSGTTSGHLSPDGFWRWDGAAWVAADPSGNPKLPRWLPIELRSPATWRVLLAAAVVALLADQALRANSLGIGAVLALAVAAGALWIVGGVRTVQGRGLLALAVVFAGWLAFRASPWLTVPDLVVSLVLLAVAASVSNRGSLFDLGFAEAGARVLHGLLHISLGAPSAVRPLGSLRPRLAGMAPIGRGLGIGVPIAVLMVALLASADPVFASFFNLNIDPGQFVLDALYALAGGIAMVGLLRLAAAQSMERVAGPSRRLGLLEGLVVIGILDAVFAAFALAQAVAASGNGVQALRQAGLTYADYARSGFFQLLWVAGITLVLLVVFSRVIDRGRGRGSVLFRLLASAAIVLTVLIVFVAFRRLSLYEAAYGFTMLRLYSHIFAVWIGLVFLLLAGDLLGLWPRRGWLLAASSLAGVAVLLTLNVVNPEDLVVRLNIDRAVSTQKLDLGYLETLSSDSVPALMSSSAHLTGDQQAKLALAVCKGARDYRSPWAAFDLADLSAAQARQGAC
jgi:hypothetical protein